MTLYDAKGLDESDQQRLAELQKKVRRPYPLGLVDRRGKGSSISIGPIRWCRPGVEHPVGRVGEQPAPLPLLPLARRPHLTSQDLAVAWRGFERASPGYSVVYPGMNVANTLPDCCHPPLFGRSHPQLRAPGESTSAANTASSAVIDGDIRCQSIPFGCLQRDIPMRSLRMSASVPWVFRCKNTGCPQQKPPAEKEGHPRLQREGRLLQQKTGVPGRQKEAGPHPGDPVR